MTGQMVPGSILINERGEINDSSIATYEQPKLFALSTNSVGMLTHGSEGGSTIFWNRKHVSISDFFRLSDSHSKQRR